MYSPSVLLINISRVITDAQYCDGRSEARRRSSGRCWAKSEETFFVFNPTGKFISSMAAAAAGISFSLFPQHKKLMGIDESCWCRDPFTQYGGRSSSANNIKPPLCMNIPNLSTSHQGPFSSFLDVCVLYAIGEEIGMADCCCPHPFSFFSFRFDSGRRECKKMGQSRDFFFFRNDATVNRATLSPPTHTHTHTQTITGRMVARQCVSPAMIYPPWLLFWGGGLVVVAPYRLDRTSFMYTINQRLLCPAQYVHF